MDFLDCKICNVSYDEEDHRPRQVPCGHGLCSACLRALIKDRIFECPNCRQKIKLEVPDDLPVNYDLIGVIRAFKTKMVPMTQETKTKDYGAANDAVCNIHSNGISHWCDKCKIWICLDCLESHTSELGCSTTKSTIAMKSMKKASIDSLDGLVSQFEKDTELVSLQIQEHVDKKKEHLEKAEKHSKEEKKLSIILEQGENPKGKLLEARKQLNEANSPNAVSEYIKIVTQRKQILRSWCSKNYLGIGKELYIRKILKINKNVYVESGIKDEIVHAKLSLHEDNIYFHKFLSQKIEDGYIVVPFNLLQHIIPSNASLVFLELSLGGIVKGRVLLRLKEDLPNIREYLVTIVTGQQGKSLKGISCNDVYQHCLGTDSLPFNKMPVTIDSCGTAKAKKGDVNGYFPNGHLHMLYIQVDSYNYPSGNNRVIGCIESGMDIIQVCHKNRSKGVVISDCGLIIEKE